MPPRIIALLTDFGQRDPFVGVMKGVILAINPELQLIDISHDIAPQQIREAAAMLAMTYRYFPRQTIFLVVVDPGVGGARRPIVAETMDYFFVAPDNGVLGPALEMSEVRRIVHATQTQYFRQPISRTFHGRDIFAPLAAWLSRGEQIGQMGTPIADYTRLELPRPRLNSDGDLEGEVLYQDHFGNLITNVAVDWLTEVWGQPPEPGVQAMLQGTVIRGLNACYAERAPQELGMIINSWGLIEVFANGGNAAQAIHASAGCAVRISRRAATAVPNA